MLLALGMICKRTKKGHLLDFVDVGKLVWAECDSPQLGSSRYMKRRWWFPSQVGEEIFASDVSSALLGPGSDFFVTSLVATLHGNIANSPKTFCGVWNERLGGQDIADNLEIYPGRKSTFVECSYGSGSSLKWQPE